MKSNIKIRSITLRLSIDDLLNENKRKKIFEQIKKLKKNIGLKKIKVTTFRICFEEIVSNKKINHHEFLNKLHLVNNFLNKHKICRWYVIPFNVIKCNLSQFRNLENLIFEIIKRYNNCFVNLIVSDEKILNTPILINIGLLIKRISIISHNSYDNFRLGLSCNQSYGTPFFPFSCIKNNQSISIALEITEILTEISRQSLNLSNFKQKFKKEFIPLVYDMQRKVSEMCSISNFKFNGVDCSIAPFPEKNISIIKIFENIGLEEFSGNGTIFLINELTSLLKNIKNYKIKITGFNGVMFSVLEDKILCKLAKQKRIGTNDLMFYSNFCGVGLDMIPLPGNITPEEIATMIIDLSLIACKNQKQLGFRILPIQNKNAGEMTDISLDFITNTRIFEVKNNNLDINYFENTLKYNEKL